MERRRWIAVVLAMLFMSACLAAALDAGDAHARGSKSKTATLLGTIYKSDTGYVLITGKTKYNLGGQDFSKFLGKKVKVRGIYTKGEKGRVLEVTKIEEAKPSKKK
ncbi:MAG TPA: hypothetical protein PLM79_03635 [Syntrophobacteraceae bacterium]|nr:hypothetical protein [Syntrophobacteraceae bacterium]